MSDIKNEIKQALEDANVLPWQYRELHRTIEYDAIQDANGKNIICISSYDQANVDFLLLAINNISSLITTIESQNGELEALNKAHHVWLKRHVNYKEQIESQKEEIERLQIDRSDWEEEYMSLKRRFEDLDKSALETLELLNGPNEQIESLKAITELAVKGLEHYAEWIDWEDDSMGDKARKALSEIERLRHE